MTQEGNIIIADEGKVFRRIGTDEMFGNTIHLGYSYYIDGVLQNPPHLDTASDFEEVDAPPEEISDTEALNIILGNYE